MAKYSFANLKIEFDLTGGTLQDMSAYITAVNGVTVEAILQNSTYVGASWETFAGTGISRMGQVTLSGLYDDTATTGPDVVFNALGVTRTLKITWGGSKTTSVETIIQSYTRTPQQGQLTAFSVVLQPTSTVTEA